MPERIEAFNLPPPPAGGFQFKLIDGWPGYGVSDDGRVWSCKKRSRRCWVIGDEWRPIKGRWAGRPGKDYLAVTLRNGTGRHCQAMIHHLVLLAFVGSRPVGMVAMHTPDPDRGNNQLSNLKWGTPAQNVQESLVQGSHRCPGQRGESHSQAKLNRRQVGIIRRSKVSGAALARRFGVSQATISLVRNNRRWKDGEL